MKCPECTETMIYFWEVQQGVCRFCGPGSAKALYRGSRIPDQLVNRIPGDMRTPAGDTIFHPLSPSEAMPLERAAIHTTADVRMLPGFGVAPGQQMQPTGEVQAISDAMQKAASGKPYCSRCLVEQAGNKVDDNIIKHDTACPFAPKNGASHNAPSAQ